MRHLTFSTTTVLVALTTCGVAGNAGPSAPSPWPSDYQKLEAMVPMRDGVELYTAVFSPKNDSRPHPILLHRTPYSCAPYGAIAFPDAPYPDPLFAEDGFVFVCQDVRGTHMSEGDWVHMRPHIPDKSRHDVDESTDGYDTIEWLVRNVPDNNGRVGIWGASYPGFYAAASMIDAHPALQCAVPQAPQMDWWYEDVHHNGAFFLAAVFWFVEELGLPRPGRVLRHPRFDLRLPTSDGYAFFLKNVGPLSWVNEVLFSGRAALWNDIVQHPNRDAFWSDRDLRPHLRNVAPAVLNVGGWFDDSNLFGTLAAYRTIERQAPESDNFLVIGPWEHTGWEWNVEGDHLGDIDFGSSTSQYFRLEIQKPFLERCLLEARDVTLDLPEAVVFETGANRWRQFDAWPPRTTESRSLYAREGNALSWHPPTDGDAFDGFTSDPARPVPYTEEILPGRSRTFMIADQGFASTRPDVLVYRSPRFEEALTLAGPLQADLWVSTSQYDADWVVKLVDEFPGEDAGAPDGRAVIPESYQMLIRAEVMRGRFREDAERPTPFEPDRPTRVSFDLRDVLHTFFPGHRIMIQIQSSWFPLVDRNPQAWVDNIYRAREEDFIAANHRLYRSASHPSRLRVGVIPSQRELPPDRARFQQDLDWSPDGEWIAYSQHRADDTASDSGSWAVLIVRSDGSHERVLVDDARYVSWSPDGERLAFSSDRDGNWAIYTIAMDGSDERRVRTGGAEDADDQQPIWSPDGRSLAFVSNRHGQKDILVVGLEGSGLRRLTNGPLDDYGPAWSPDGNHVVFYRQEVGGKDQVHIVSIDGSRSWQVTRDDANNLFPSFLPDGRVAFVSQTADGRGRLVVTSLDGSERNVVTNVSPFFARWSRDGSRIAFIAGKWPRSAIYSMAADGTALLEIVN